MKIFHFFSSNLLTRVASYLNSSSGLNDRKHRKDQKNQGGFRETKKKNEKFEKVVLRRGRINKSLRATLHATVWWCVGATPFFGAPPPHPVLFCRHLCLCVEFFHCSSSVNFPLCQGCRSRTLAVAFSTLRHSLIEFFFFWFNFSPYYFCLKPGSLKRIIAETLLLANFLRRPVLNSFQTLRSRINLKNLLFWHF